MTPREAAVEWIRSLPADTDIGWGEDTADAESPHVMTRYADIVVPDLCKHARLNWVWTI